MRTKKATKVDNMCSNFKVEKKKTYDIEYVFEILNVCT